MMKNNDLFIILQNRKNPFPYFLLNTLIQIFVTILNILEIILWYSRYHFQLWYTSLKNGCSIASFAVILSYGSNASIWLKRSIAVSLPYGKKSPNHWVFGYSSNLN